MAFAFIPMYNYTIQVAWAVCGLCGVLRRVWYSIAATGRRSGIGSGSGSGNKNAARNTDGRKQNETPENIGGFTSHNHGYNRFFIILAKIPRFRGAAVRVGVGSGVIW